MKLKVEGCKLQVIDTLDVRHRKTCNLQPATCNFPISC
jgi:hypothetical protein